MLKWTVVVSFFITIFQSGLAEHILNVLHSTGTEGRPFKIKCKKTASYIQVILPRGLGAKFIFHLRGPKSSKMVKITTYRPFLPPNQIIERKDNNWFFYICYENISLTCMLTQKHSNGEPYPSRHMTSKWRRTEFHIIKSHRRQSDVITTSWVC